MCAKKLLNAYLLFTIGASITHHAPTHADVGAAIAGTLVGAAAGIASCEIEHAFLAPEARLITIPRLAMWFAERWATKKIVAGLCVDSSAHAHAHHALAQGFKETKNAHEAFKALSMSERNTLTHAYTTQTFAWIASWVAYALWHKHKQETHKRKLLQKATI